jgi:predicted metal-binding membrane protein
MKPDLARVLKRDRLIVAVALAMLIVLAWSYLLAGAGMGTSAADMTRMALDEAAHRPRDDGDASAGMDRSMNMSMPMPAHPQPVLADWSAGYVVVLFFMWWIMMIAMMLPAATPVVLLAATVNRRATAASAPYGSTGAFLLGYLLAWAAFSAVAVLAQWALGRSGLLSDALRATRPELSGVLLIAAGLWQFTPLKQSCLAHCRSPVTFLTEHRRSGNAGAMRMGLEHGLDCLGCCWFLMALLFVGGVMNLIWIAGLAIYVLAEKILPAARPLSRWAGAGLIVWGLMLLASGLESDSTHQSRVTTHDSRATSHQPPVTKPRLSA